jgi:hypothetical protein
VTDYDDYSKKTTVGNEPEKAIEKTRPQQKGNKATRLGDVGISRSSRGHRVEIS